MYEQAVLDESVPRGAVSANSLLDIAKAYEAMDPGNIIEGAVDSGFPLVIVRLAPSSFEAERRLAVGPAFAEEKVRARSTILAGST